MCMSSQVQPSVEEVAVRWRWAQSACYSASTYCTAASVVEWNKSSRSPGWNRHNNSNIVSGVKPASQLRLSWIRIDSNAGWASGSVATVVGGGSDHGDTLTGMIPLLTERDAAIRLRVTLNDINALLESGTLPYSVIGGEIRITDEDIRDFVRRTRTQGSTLPRRSDHECKL